MKVVGEPPARSKLNIVNHFGCGCAAAKVHTEISFLLHMNSNNVRRYGHTSNDYHSDRSQVLKLITDYSVDRDRVGAGAECCAP